MNSTHTDKYTIYIGNDFSSLLNSFLKTQKYSSVFILVDDNTRKHCLKSLNFIKNKYEIIQIKSGESNKNISTCEKIWSELTKKNASRKSLLINLGGGVISDLGGYTASTYKRGIDFINIPTTLLSQVDASIGGKTSINFSGFKNQIGTFSFPKYVLINTNYLKSLPQRECNSGFAEIIKHSLIADKQYWAKIKKTIAYPISLYDKRANWNAIVSKSITIKNKITLADPLEKGDRKKLNFGHTIGHAIESASLKTKKTLLHGEAIAIGMICESYISWKKSGLSTKELEDISDFIFNCFEPKKIDHSFNKLLRLMRQDKKNNGININFTLLNSIGKSNIDNACSDELIKASIQYFNTMCKIRQESIPLHKGKMFVDSHRH